MNVEPVLQGAKIISMKVGTWKFIDSLMFMPMPLSAMPKSFGLTELKKGHWPYLADKPEFYQYEGPLLDKVYYCVSNMKGSAAKTFHEWYDEQVVKNYVFNFRRELIEYCISDVTILRQACEAFRKLFEQVAGFDPMFNCMTLSAACMAAFRRNFLKKDTIGIVPPGGYHGRGKQSHMALKWLDYESHKLGRVISTIYTDREISVMGRRVDGYVEIPQQDGIVEKRIYQFHGCYWHHCPTHYPANEDSGENRYPKTKEITELFRRNGYTVIEMWECEFETQLASDPDTKEYFRLHPTTRIPPLNLRDGLAGGRTSAMRCHHKADLEKGEKIKFVDVISEYPNANLRAEYPVGHPEVFVEGTPCQPPAIEEWNGMIKCTVLPPRDLYLPVLWYKCNNKLLFPLCRICAETESKVSCHHEPHERELTGSWCAPELHLALKKGYQLRRVHEVYQYPGTMQYDPETKRDGLLSAYVRCFMALKIQASGWPADCESQEQKDKYVADTLKYDGVVLDPAKMVKNPALRTLAKLMCNSFWGKFGEKTMRPKTHFVYNYEQLLKLVTDRGDPQNIKYCIKVRGITINSSCDQLVTFENLKAMVMGSRDKITVPIPHQIVRLTNWKIVTRDTNKRWQAQNTKRRRVDVANTVPHGYNAWDMAEEEDQDLLEAMEFLADA
ncbi:putative DNA polymerase [Frankliniella fusca]|uniref:DNA-directed DNA polymerase n=1 Tax=Frankliniella fusca TaxID=407009 RepID=A0AAE1LDY6_9NEOP|nr:putative DNA polymerase [Frankliniella fusca]